MSYIYLYRLRFTIPPTGGRVNVKPRLSRSCSVCQRYSRQLPVRDDWLRIDPSSLCDQRILQQGSSHNRGFP